jgi:Na+/phosphate symporter
MMSEHIVKAFDDDLQELDRSKIAEMGGLAEQQLADAIDALSSATSRWPTASSPNDAIDALQREIEEKAILMIAKRQPMARDLREIMAAIRIANDLERIGDLAKNIAKRVIASERLFQPQADAAASSTWPAGAQEPAQERARRLFASRDADAGARGLARDERSTRSTPRCSANSSPT